MTQQTSQNPSTPRSAAAPRPARRSFHIMGWRPLEVFASLGQELIRVKNAPRTTVGAISVWVALVALTLGVFQASTSPSAPLVLRDAGRQMLIWGLPESITLGIPGNLTLIRDERASLALAGQGEYLADTDAGAVAPDSSVAKADKILRTENTRVGPLNPILGRAFGIYWEKAKQSDHASAESTPFPAMQERASRELAEQMVFGRSQSIFQLAWSSALFFGILMLSLHAFASLMGGARQHGGLRQALRRSRSDLSGQVGMAFFAPAILIIFCAPLILFALHSPIGPRLLGSSEHLNMTGRVLFDDALFDPREEVALVTTPGMLDNGGHSDILRARLDIAKGDAFVSIGRWSYSELMSPKAFSQLATRASALSGANLSRARWLIASAQNDNTSFAGVWVNAGLALFFFVALFTAPIAVIVVALNIVRSAALAAHHDNQLLSNPFYDSNASADFGPRVARTHINMRAKMAGIKKRAVSRTRGYSSTQPTENMGPQNRIVPAAPPRSSKDTVQNFAKRDQARQKRHLLQGSDSGDVLSA